MHAVAVMAGVQPGNVGRDQLLVGGLQRPGIAQGGGVARDQRATCLRVQVEDVANYGVGRQGGQEAHFQHASMTTWDDDIQH